MNIRKNIDYTDLYEALDALMVQQLPQMELYCGIGKAVCRRTEKGAAVMASEYLNQHYPDVKGFSPRSLRRMRDFYHTYEDHPSLLSRAMKLGWTLNVVIMEADLTMKLREWYMKAADRFGWSKTELMAQISAEAHLEIVLDIEEDVCDHGYDEESASRSIQIANAYFSRWLARHFIQRCCRRKTRRGVLPWLTMSLPNSRQGRLFLSIVRNDSSSDIYTMYILGALIDRSINAIALRREIVDNTAKREAYGLCHGVQR